jgi:hypothetical protein
MAEATTYLVRNLARDPTNHAARRLRPGNKTGFVLSNGTRIRRRNTRGTTISHDLLAEDANRVCEAVAAGYIEVQKAGKVLSAKELESSLGVKTPAAPVAEPPPVDAPPLDTVVDPQPDGEGEEWSEEDLRKLNRAELNTLAKEWEITDPESYPTKGALVEAMLSEED